MGKCALLPKSIATEIYFKIGLTLYSWSRMVLLTDITYLPYNGIFAYLSTILDAYTKQILAYVLSDSLEVDFVVETVNNLIRDHGVSLHAETIVHSDQGCHYTSHSFIDILHDKDLRQSMSRRGNCWDNAPQESFFGRMKDHVKKKIAAAKLGTVIAKKALDKGITTVVFDRGGFIYAGKVKALAEAAREAGLEF